MATTQLPPQREAALRRAPERMPERGSADHAASFDPTQWQRILQQVRLHHPTLNREWFTQLNPRQLTNGVIQANITPSTTVMAYAPDASVWGDEYISEKVETKAGWQFPAPEEDWMRGYPQEFDDFVAAIAERREPLSGALLAREVVEVIYAGYLSAATGRRVELAR